MSRETLVNDDQARTRSRSKLPDVDLLYVPDIAAFYGKTPAAIRKRIRLGKAGPWMQTGREYAIRRCSFLRWLDEQEQRS